MTRATAISSATSRSPEGTVHVAAGAGSVRVPGRRSGRAHPTSGVAALSVIGCGLAVGNASAIATGPHRGGLLLRTAALGFAAGARSTMGVAGVLLISRGARAGTAHGLRRGLLTAGALAVGAELVADKLPVTPSRLQPSSLVVRVASGCGGGAALARQANAHLAVATLLGGVCAAAGSLAGAAWREAASTRMPSWAGALVEDAAALLLTVAATRPHGHGPRRAH